MSKKFYNTKTVAEKLGVSVEEVKRMQQDREIYGYRDGSDWKFKIEEIDQLVEQRADAPPAEQVADAAPVEQSEDDNDVLLTEVELGQSGAGASGTVIGMEAIDGDASGSDLQAADSDIQLADDATTIAAPSDEAPVDEVGSQVSQFEELDLTLEDDLTIEDSVVGARGQAEEVTPGSAVNLSGDDLDDDDVVLGGSGAGSDIAIGADSGISLVDPSDSGFALDEPLDLAGGTDVSLELQEDSDIIVSGADEAPVELQTDDDFLLTPLEEVGDEDSASGSQVIALDDAGAMADAGAPGGAMAAMLGEEFAPQGALGMDPGDDPLGAAEGQQFGQSAAMLPEAPYSALNIVSLVFCALVLVVCGIMMFDLVRNMWSWDGPYELNSSLMDWILSLVE
jgi:excisionase family DNA binding protein